MQPEHRTRGFQQAPADRLAQGERHKARHPMRYDLPYANVHMLEYSRQLMVSLKTREVPATMLARLKPYGLNYKDCQWRVDEYAKLMRWAKHDFPVHGLKNL